MKATALFLLSCIFVMLFTQRFRLYMFCLFPLSEPYNPPSWWTKTGFLHIKRIKTFGYKTCNREGIRKKFKILKKNNIEALVVSIEKTTKVALVDDRTVVIIIWRPKRVFNVFRRKLSLGAPVNYCLTLPLLSLLA